MKICRKCRKTIYHDKCTFCGYENEGPDLSVSSTRDEMNPSYEDYHRRAGNHWIFRSPWLKYGGLILAILGFGFFFLVLRGTTHARTSAYYGYYGDIGDSFVPCLSITIAMMVIGMAIYWFVRE